jgi:hypothetical protein
MDHATTMRRAYELISAGDIDGFGALELVRGYRTAFPDMQVAVDEVIATDEAASCRLPSVVNRSAGGA